MRPLAPLIVAHDVKYCGETLDKNARAVDITRRIVPPAE
jgi:hypothetical protein